MRNWGSRTNRYRLNHTVPHKSRCMFIWGPAGLYFIKILPIFIIILVFLFNGIIPISHQTRAKETGAVPSPIGKDVSVGPGQVFLICSSFLRPLPALERNKDVLSRLGPRRDRGDYNPGRRIGYRDKNPTTEVIVREGILRVRGRGLNGEPVGEGVLVAAGSGVNVGIDALPRSIAEDKMPPLRADAAEIIGGLTSLPLLRSVTKEKAGSSI